jgi:hypothetical protein
MALARRFCLVRSPSQASTRFGDGSIVPTLRSDGARGIYEATLDYEDNPYLFGAHLIKETIKKMGTTRR